MKSIARHIDEYDIVQEVRIERAAHKGSFLLLEGETDIKRFAPFVDNIECSMVNCYGRNNAIEAIKILDTHRFGRALACIDADFDRIQNRLYSHKSIIYSEYHDFDIDWVNTGAFEKYCYEVASESKISDIGGYSVVMSKILEGLKPISCTKLLNVNRKFRYKVKHVDAATCFSSFQVDFDVYFNEIFKEITPPHDAKANLEGYLEKLLPMNINLLQITNGHDFHSALGASLRTDIGDRRDVHTWGKEVEMHIRLSFELSDFAITKVSRFIYDWEVQNSPYLVLKSDVRKTLAVRAAGNP